MAPRLVLLLSMMTYLLLSVPQKGFGCTEDSSVRYIADYLLIKYKVLENDYKSSSVYLAQINFTNSGSDRIRNGNWSIYFSHTQMIGGERVLGNGGVPLGDSGGLWVHHYNGVLYWLEPTKDFSDLLPSQTLSVTFNCSFWMVARTDALPNWYAVSRDRDCTDAYVIHSTIGESLDYVAPFETAKQWKRLKSDRYDPLTPQVRYEADFVNDTGMAVWKVLPTPLSANYGSTTVNLITSNFVVVVVDNDTTLMNEAQLLADKLGLILVPWNVSPGKNVIFLKTGSVSDASDVSDIAGSYSLQISLTNVSIIGRDSSGVFYAVQSLLNLADTSVPGEVPVCVIKDSPRFKHRGQHIDVSRNFHTVDDLKRLMDGMALYKLNRLHIHMGDDEGWRLEIPGIPELTKVGSQRCHDASGDVCLMPQLGSSPKLPNTGSGYYTVGDYRSILTYANDRHIVVIPEFDMPGHSHAAVRSMLARYRAYSSTNISEAERYLLTDLNDSSSYLSVQFFTDNAINPCVNGTYNFIEKVMSEVKKMHGGIQPLLQYHIGGDEVASGAWLNSPKCLTQFGVNVTQGQVKSYFLRRINEILIHLNLTGVAWEDGLTLDQRIVNRTDLFNGDVMVNTWDNVWEWGTGGRAYAFANADYKVVLNHATHLFFDFPSEPDPEERGYYWATRTIPMKKTFSYMPDDVYANIDTDVDRMGNALNRSIICPNDESCPPLDASKASNIVGMQSQAWSETMRNSDELDYMIFPRLLALAERAWHKADWEDVTDLSKRNSMIEVDWEGFANTLGYKELRRLDDIRIKYRIPLVGARVKGSTISVTSGLPGLPIEYKAKQETDWKTLTGSSLKVETDGTFEFRTRSSDGKRHSRSISVDASSRPIVSGVTRCSLYSGFLSLALTFQLFLYIQ